MTKEEVSKLIKDNNLALVSQEQKVFDDKRLYAIIHYGVKGEVTRVAVWELNELGEEEYYAYTPTEVVND